MRWEARARLARSGKSASRAMRLPSVVAGRDAQRRESLVGRGGRRGNSDENCRGVSGSLGSGAG